MGPFLLVPEYILGQAPSIVWNWEMWLMPLMTKKLPEF